jgi:hypothetical protein
MARVRPEQLGWYLSDNLAVTSSISQSVIISGSNPLTLIGLEIVPTASYDLTYDITTGLVSYRSSGYAPPFPYSGSAVITGSLLVSGSFSTIGNSKFTGSLFLSSGSFSGSGANLFNIPASAIVGLNLSRIATGSVTASVDVNNNLFLIRSSSIDMFKVQPDKVVVLASSSVTPTPVSGGIFFSSSGDFFFGS